MKNVMEMAMAEERSNDKMRGIARQVRDLLVANEKNILAVAKIIRDVLIPESFGGLSARKWYATFSGAPLVGTQPAGYRNFARSVALAKNAEKFARVEKGERIDVVLQAVPKPVKTGNLSKQVFRLVQKIKNLEPDPKLLQEAIALLQKPDVKVAVSA